MILFQGFQFMVASEAEASEKKGVIFHTFLTHGSQEAKSGRTGEEGATRDSKTIAQWPASTHPGASFTNILSISKV